MPKPWEEYNHGPWSAYADQAKKAGPSVYEEIAKSNSAAKNIGAGFGGALYGIPLGLRQLTGNADQQEVNQWADSMKGLTSTPSGFAGALVGGAAPAVAVGMVPGANTVLGAGVAGMGLGFAQPVEEGGTRLGNTLKGGLFNSALPAGVALGKTAAAVTSPFYQGGREAIAGRTLQRFATDPNNIANAGNVTWSSGAIPTLAEASGDTGLANLQRTIQTMDTRGLVAQRFADNNAKRLEALDDMAGGPMKRNAAVAAREQAAGPLYAKADASIAPIDDGFKNLLSRPSFTRAVASADRFMRDKGMAGVLIKDADGKPVGITGEGAHLIKKALDDMADKTSKTFAGNESARSAMRVQDAFLSWLDGHIPEYAQAAKTFEAASKPINQMDVAEKLSNVLTSGLRDFNTNPKMYGQNFARALANEDQTIKAATGMRSRGLADVMEPNQVAMLQSIKKELGAQADAVTAGRVPGSPTAQYLIGQDVVGKIAGPLGIPKSAAGSTFVENMLSRPATFMLKTPEDKLIGLLSEAMLDPKKAAALLTKANPTKTEKTLQKILDKSMPFGQGGLLGYSLVPAEK